MNRGEWGVPEEPSLHTPGLAMDALADTDKRNIKAFIKMVKVQHRNGGFSEADVPLNKRDDGDYGDDGYYEEDDDDDWY